MNSVFPISFELKFKSCLALICYQGKARANNKNNQIEDHNMRKAGARP